MIKLIDLRNGLAKPEKLQNIVDENDAEFDCAIETEKLFSISVRNRSGILE